MKRRAELRATPAVALLLALAGCISLPPADPGGRPARDGPPPGADPARVQAAAPAPAPEEMRRTARGNPPFYRVDGVRYRVMDDAAGYRERGIASWYGRKFHGRPTSSGEPFDMYALTAAHKHLPLPSYVEVTALRTGRKVVVRVNDRGPFVPGRLIDLSWGAAVRLGIAEQGTAEVEIRTVPAPSGARVRTTASAGGRGSGSGADPAWYLQVGAFGDGENARRLERQLAGLDLAGAAVATTRDEDGLFRVRIGPLLGADHAGTVADALEAAGLHDYRTVAD